MNTTPCREVNLCLFVVFVFSFPPWGSEFFEKNLVPNFKLSICIQSETNTLKHPMGNVPCGVKISFKNKANAHRVPSHGGGVHRCPEGILEECGRKGRHWIVLKVHESGNKRSLYERWLTSEIHSFCFCKKFHTAYSKMLVVVLVVLRGKWLFLNDLKIGRRW